MMMTLFNMDLTAAAAAAAACNLPPSGESAMRAARCTAQRSTAAHLIIISYPVNSLSTVFQIISSNELQFRTD